MKRTSALIVSGFCLTLICAAQQISSGATDGIYREEGIASWYGHEFDGRPTASGEIFDASLFTAAHPTLPFGTLLTITNKQNSKRVMVRVNDRGPNKSDRVIDVSRAAADQLDMIATGTTSVLIESIGTLVVTPSSAPTAPAPTTLIPVTPSTTTQTAPTTSAAPVTSPVITPQPSYVIPAEIKPSMPPSGTNKRYRLQVGAYRVDKNAVEAFDKLKNAGLNPKYERVGEYYRVVLLDVKAEEVSAMAEKLGALGFREALVREEP
ncbi:MAG: septal ring lytic transglycosylase RlpA family protein [Treponema sp.]|jgi:rare lipoprotein A|nr:septal ring lytic transglycosylase RlpA family protein [Treponema sp.]